MQVVIVSSLSDYHAAAVRWALECAGVQVVQWEGPGHQPERWALAQLTPERRVILGRQAVEPGSAVWYRRPRPLAENPSVVESDWRFALGEARRFSRCLGECFEALGCRCVNPRAAAERVNIKAAQIIAAERSGLAVPETLMGNDGKVIAALIGGGRRWIHKTFLPHVWETQGGGRAFTVTAEVTDHGEPARQQWALTQGIYQRLLTKAADARVMLIGGALRAFELRASGLDCRIDVAKGTAGIAEVPLPDTVARGLRAFVAATGIVFGCFDFAIEDDGRWWFLEVNESGQFLWIDEQLPGAGVYQDFAAFLGGGSPSDYPALQDCPVRPEELPNPPRSELEFHTFVEQ